jgi:hypothetical protein
MNAPLLSRRDHTACTIVIEHSEDNLHAHVELDGDEALAPGDEVRVHGEAIKVAFGQKLTLRRPATIIRAGWLLRAWTKLRARFELAELYELSFTPRRLH